MSEQKKRPFRKEYLNDFRRDPSGKYVYTGEYKIYSDKNESWGRENVFLWICCALPAALLIILGLIPGSALAGNALIMAPYAFSVLTLFIVIWKLVRFSYAGRRMRKYVYEQTVEVMPVYAFIAAALGAASVVCMVISLLNGSYMGGAGAAVLNFVSGAALAAGGTLTAVKFRKMEWKTEV